MPQQVLSGGPGPADATGTGQVVYQPLFTFFLPGFLSDFRVRHAACVSLRSQQQLQMVL